MTETNALAGASDTAPSSDQTQNDRPPTETTLDAQSTPEGQETEAAADKAEAKDAGTEGEKPETKPEKRQPSERIRELVRERNETEIALYTEREKNRSAQNEIRRLRKALDDPNISEVRRQVLESRIEEKTVEAEATAEAVKEKQEQARAGRLQVFSEKVGDAKIIDAFCSLPRVSEELADLVAESDYAKELAAKLSANPSEARRLSSLPPHRVGAEIARMEIAFSRQPAVRHVSQAPETSTRLKGGSSPAAFSPEKASVDGVAAQLRKAGVIR